MLCKKIEYVFGRCDNSFVFSGFCGTRDGDDSASGNHPCFIDVPQAKEWCRRIIQGR